MQLATRILMVALATLLLIATKLWWWFGNHFFTYLLVADVTSRKRACPLFTKYIAIMFALW